MFHPLPLFIGLRYARARTHRYFVSFITWVSLAGVSVGVAVLIVILSVMNGFESELRNRLVALSAPVRVSAPPGTATDWPRVQEQLRGALPGITVERFAELPVLAVRQPDMKPLLLRAANESTLQKLQPMLVQGRIEPLEQGRGLVLGVQVAQALGSLPGDMVTLLVPGVSGSIVEFNLRKYPVAGVFEADVQDHDSRLAYANLAVLQELGVARSHAEGLSLHPQDALAAPGVAARVREVLARDWPGLVVGDWTEEHASYFRAIRIEKTMMALILLLVVAVAAFNIVAMLVMVVTDKRTDIAILRTFGAGPRTVARVFIAQGLVIGWLGVAAGVALGWLIASNVGPILDFLYAVAGISLFDPDVYYITEVPSEMHAVDVVLVAVAALVVTALATIYPALRASRTSPAEALRYE